MTPDTEKALLAFADSLLEAEKALQRAVAAVMAEPNLGDPATIDPGLVARLAIAGDAAAHLSEKAGSMALVLTAAGGANGLGWRRALSDALDAERDALPSCPCDTCAKRHAEVDAVVRKAASIVENTR